MKKIFSALLVVVMLVSLLVGIQANAAGGNLALTLRTASSSYDGNLSANIDVFLDVTGVTDSTPFGSAVVKFTFDNTKFNIVNGTSATTGGNGTPKFLSATGNVIKNATLQLSAAISLGTAVEVVGNLTKVGLVINNNIPLGMQQYDSDGDEEVDTAFVPNGTYGKFTLTPKAPVAAGDTTLALVVGGSDTSVNDGAVPPTKHTITPVNKTITFTAAVVNRTLTFDMAGGTGTPASAVVLDGTKFVAPTQPTKAGYNFAGWFNGLTEYVAGTTTISANATLTAHWTVVPVTDIPLVSGDVVKEAGKDAVPVKVKNGLGQIVDGTVDNAVVVTVPGKVPATIDSQEAVEAHEFGIEFGGVKFPAGFNASTFANLTLNGGKYIIKLVDTSGKLTGKTFKAYNYFDTQKSTDFINITID